MKWNYRAERTFGMPAQALVMALGLFTAAQGQPGQAPPGIPGALAPQTQPARGDFRFGPRAGFLDDVKQKISATDPEWKVIGPKLRKVVNLRQVLEADRVEAALSPTDGNPGGGFRSGPGGNSSFGGPGGGGPGGGPGGRGGFRGPPPEMGPGLGGPGGPPPQDSAPGGPGAPGANPGNPPPPPDAAPRNQPVQPAQPPQREDFRGFRGRDRGGFGPGRDFGPPGGPGDFAGGPAGRGGFRGGPGGPFGQSDALSPLYIDLKTVLKDSKSTPEEIQAKVIAIRQAIRKIRADLAAAEKDLLELLTADQVAVLVSLGYLE